jgi:hypothetical protein
MLRYFAVASVAVVGLFTVAAVPAEAGASTGSWKYWTPYSAHAAPPHWPHVRQQDGPRYAGEPSGDTRVGTVRSVLNGSVALSASSSGHVFRGRTH